MSTGRMTLSNRRPAAAGLERRGFPRLADARIRSKLGLLLLVPLIAVVALAAVRLVDVSRQASDATLIRSLSELSIDVSALTQNLHKERMAAAAFLATPEARTDAYNLRVRGTDELVVTYRARRANLPDLPDTVRDRLAAIDGHLAGLAGIREETLARGQMSVAEAVLRYGVVLNDLVAYGEALGQVSGEGDLAESLRAMAAFARAKVATAEEEAVVFVALTSGGLSEEQFSAFVATLTSQQEAFVAFAGSASAAQRAAVDRTVTGDASLLADQVSAQLTRSVGEPAPFPAAVGSPAIGAVTDLMRYAETNLERDLLGQADDARSAAVRQATVEGTLVLTVLLIAVLLAIVIARSLNRSLFRLRDGALTVANHSLPESVARLRELEKVGEGGVEEIVSEVRDPIQLTNRDEVGEVAVAFNVVHREAVRIAAEQAALRTSVSAMFLTLARRSQTLVDRIIGELDSIERGEEDPKRLAKLFVLDHLATRMRRNDENLLVLAGADTAPPRREDALLIDALRAAQSEVEFYNRIEFGTVDPDISVSAHAVNDVVRILSELLDNATRFSPPNTVVVADARRIRDYVVVQVEDRGLGLDDDQLEVLNHRLRSPSPVDVSAFRLMGLAVVSRLAARYRILVELRRTLDQGTVALVTLPAEIVVLPQAGRPPTLLPRKRVPAGAEVGGAAASNGHVPGGSAWANRASATTLAEPPPTPAQWDVPLPQRPGFATDPLPPAATPMAGGGFPRPPVAGGDSALLAEPNREATTEMPIFREMEAVWFQSHGHSSTQILNLPGDALPPPRPTAAPVPPGAGSVPPMAAPVPPGAGSVPPMAAPGRGPLLPGAEPVVLAPAAAPSPAPMPPPVPPPVPPTVPPQRTAPVGDRSAGGDDLWRTAADEGWDRATKAASPLAGGTTRSGLPKRVPQAQLVPGGVETRPSQGVKRAPEEVRGLLSAYHRGVQRGRVAGAELDNTPPSKENR
ncbi:nitrate- and nitrite sensing domain-containing protein [Asanoa sp. WMMD1127]|uniref:sensor histidine kinase n=1 Tax=Asanoa sp. WMMD1127 TaxID=3016107 RepID=UPI00241689EF|nr:nitrate- and nitrite sensing domain-containing protein [Asanoa sp. WMMD1127]MDG4820464.1 nitrate- and nitrite sensing domain-containing protein [Asanoa sp. WMMD1127]